MSFQSEFLKDLCSNVHIPLGLRIIFSQSIDTGHHHETRDASA